MIEIFPNYYDKFNCIADKCRHSCCIGWEIDIDPDTMELYSSIGDENILKNIEGNPPHFKLAKDERCPFLNKGGLCDIITKYGDGALCDICYLHPRFTNFYENFEETGLGLSCEEAARIVLSHTDKFAIEIPEVATEEERAFLEKRQSVFDILQNRDVNIAQRFSDLAKEYGFEFEFSLKKLAEIYMSLERLDDKWTETLEDLKDFNFDGSIFSDADMQLFFEQLSCYFIFRHFENEGAVKFALSGCYIIGAIITQTNADFQKASDIVRMYSSEIEYSEENTNKLFLI